MTTASHGSAHPGPGQYFGGAALCAVIAAIVVTFVSSSRDSWHHTPRSTSIITKRLVAHEKRVLARATAPVERSEALSAAARPE